MALASRWTTQIPWASFWLAIIGASCMPQGPIFVAPQLNA